MTSLYEEPSPLVYEHGYAVARFGLLAQDLIDSPITWRGSHSTPRVATRATREPSACAIAG